MSMISGLIHELTVLSDKIKNIADAKGTIDRAIDTIEMLQECDSDCIGRKAVIELIESKITDGHLQLNDDIPLIDASELIDDISDLQGNQPQVHPTVSKTEIVRTLEEIAEIMNLGLLCDCCSILSQCDRNTPKCKENIIDWLTKKEV